MTSRKVLLRFSIGHFLLLFVIILEDWVKTGATPEHLNDSIASSDILEHKHFRSSEAWVITVVPMALARLLESFETIICSSNAHVDTCVILKQI